MALCNVILSRCILSSAFYKGDILSSDFSVSLNEHHVFSQLPICSVLG